ncbi:hypothetical protein FACS1894190_01590 [Spirochaetia bacterium]|nr:hypothetical protein FACS1894190_01590 [Spirochaetia bacterium]
MFSNTSDVYQYSAYIGGFSLPYLANMYIEIYDKKDRNKEYETDFKVCLAKTTLSAVGMNMSEE